MKQLVPEVPAGHRLVTCGSCTRQQLIPDDGEQMECYCGVKLPKY